MCPISISSRHKRIYWRYHSPRLALRGSPRKKSSIVGRTIVLPWFCLVPHPEQPEPTLYSGIPRKGDNFLYSLVDFFLINNHPVPTESTKVICLPGDSLSGSRSTVCLGGEHPSKQSPNCSLTIQMKARVPSKVKQCRHCH